MIVSPVIGDSALAAYCLRLSAEAATPLVPSLGRLPSRRRGGAAHLPALPRGPSSPFDETLASPSRVRASAPAAGLERRSRATQDAFHRRDPRLFIEAAPAQVRLNGHARLRRTLLARADLRLPVTGNSDRASHECEPSRGEPVARFRWAPLHRTPTNSRYRAPNLRASAAAG